MDEFFKELNIDKNRITHEFLAWNLKMTATTALLCSFSIAPYIYLNQGTNNLKKPTWVFPVLRATGGFITATLIQLLIQRRITTLSDQYLKRDQMPNRNDPKAAAEPADTQLFNTLANDIEAAVEPGDTKKLQMETDANLGVTAMCVYPFNDGCTHMAVTVPPPYRFPSICCGIYWMF